MKVVLKCQTYLEIESGVMVHRRKLKFTNRNFLEQTKSEFWDKNFFFFCFFFEVSPSSKDKRGITLQARACL